MLPHLALLLLLVSLTIPFLPSASGMVVKTVGEFGAQRFIKQALAQPHSVTSVLSYFFGTDYADDKQVELRMKKGQALGEMQNFWYNGGPEYDALSQPFRDTIRDAGKGQLQTDDWQKSVDGVVAQMILCDQLARNVFRGTPEAMAYDVTSLNSARRLYQAVVATGSQAEELSGEVYPLYLSFAAVAFMHSETKADHESSMNMLDVAQERHSEPELEKLWKMQKQMELDHKEIIDRFGRYPHRNSLYDRENTPEEAAWLADWDNIPEWAKSQMKPPSQANT